jgi:hypothetical protein
LSIGLTTLNKPHKRGRSWAGKGPEKHGRKKNQKKKKYVIKSML